MDKIRLTQNQRTMLKNIRAAGEHGWQRPTDGDRYVRTSEGNTLTSLIRQKLVRGDGKTPELYKLTKAGAAVEGL